MPWFRLFLSFSVIRKIHFRKASECLTFFSIHSFINIIPPFFIMSHTLPSLNYSTDSLEPHIDARTMEIHHGKHHQTYVDKLNAALADEENLSGMKVNDLIKDLTIVPEPIRQAVRNNGGGHSNHTFFWKMLSPNGGGAPHGTLADAISSTFGSLDAFKELFANAALTRFGSGWAWLIKREDGSLAVTSTPNQDSPLMEGIADETGTHLSLAWTFGNMPTI